MRKFILTSPLFEGSVMFGYNAKGWLTFLNNEAVFDDTQYSWLFREDKFPKRIELLSQLVATIKGTVKELPPDISFAVFWDTYDKKINKIRAEPLYKKLSEANKMKAIAAIAAYQKYCERSGRGIADPEKYIKSAYWETDWAKQR